MTKIITSSPLYTVICFIMLMLYLFGLTGCASDSQSLRQNNDQHSTPISGPYLSTGTGGIP